MRWQYTREEKTYTTASTLITRGARTSLTMSVSHVDEVEVEVEALSLVKSLLIDFR